MDAPAPTGSTLFKKAVPVLAAQDIAVSLAFYAGLGFPTHFQYHDYAAFTLGDASSGEIEIHLWQCDDRRIAEHTGCRVEVEGVDALYEKCRDAGAVHPNGDLQEKPWGTREFVLVDPAGNIITFFQRMEK